MNEENIDYNNRNINNNMDNINNNNQNDENNNNINNENNINNNNNNQVLFEPQNVEIYPKKYTSITISFLIILIINIIIEIYSQYNSLNYRKYVFQYTPIYEKWQYYRFITSYFIHYGIFHLLIELYISYKLFYFFENFMGTLMTLTFILISMVINSFLHFLMVPIAQFLLKIGAFYHDLNYDYESSLTSVLFSMLTFLLLLKENKDKRFDLFYTIFIKVKYVSFICLVTLYCFTPNKSFFSNLSGIISGYLFKFMPAIFLPRVTWINDFEIKYKLKKFEGLYRCINYKNKSMRNALNEIQIDSVVEDSLLKNKNVINYGNDFNTVGTQMNELSNNINTNINNENN